MRKTGRGGWGTRAHHHDGNRQGGGSADIFAPHPCMHTCNTEWRSDREQIISKGGREGGRKEDDGRVPCCCWRDGPLCVWVVLVLKPSLLDALSLVWFAADRRVDGWWLGEWSSLRTHVHTSSQTAWTIWERVVCLLRVGGGGGVYAQCDGEPNNRWSIESSRLGFFDISTISGVPLHRARTRNKSVYWALLKSSVHCAGYNNVFVCKKRRMHSHTHTQRWWCTRNDDDDDD